VSITERVKAAWSAISTRRAARRESRGEQELKRRAARAQRNQHEHAEHRPPDNPGIGTGGFGGF